MAGTYTNTTYDANDLVGMERMAEQMGMNVSDVMSKAGLGGWSSADEIRNALFPGQTPSQINDAFYKYRTTVDPSSTTYNGLPTGGTPTYPGQITDPTQITQSGAGGSVGGPLVYTPADSAFDKFMLSPTPYLAGLGGIMGAAGAFSGAAGGLGDLSATDLAGTGGVASMGGGAFDPALLGGVGDLSTTDLAGTGGTASMGGGSFDPATLGAVTSPSIPNLPQTTTGMPGGGTAGSGVNAGIPTGSDALNQDWWSQYGLSSDPTSMLGTGAKGILDSLVGSGVSTSNLASLLGKLGAAGLGAYASNQQSNSLNNLAQQYLGLGAPSRARFEASMTPGFDPTSIPGYSGALSSASQSILSKLSATGGNPFGNPGGLIEANKQIVNGTALPAIQTYQNQNLAAGGLSTLATTAPSLQSQAIGQNANIYNSLGYGLNAVTNPQPSLSDLIKSLNMGGLT